MKSLADTLADIQAEIDRQKATGNVSPLVAGIIAHEMAEAADIEPTEWDLIDDEAALRSLPGYYDGF